MGGERDRRNWFLHEITRLSIRMYCRNGVRLLFLFSFLYLSSIQRVDADKNQTRSTREDEAIMRTLAKIQSQSEAGRLVVLFCRVRCLKEREQVRASLICVQ